MILIFSSCSITPTPVFEKWPIPPAPRMKTVSFDNTGPYCFKTKEDMDNLRYNIKAYRVYINLLTEQIELMNEVQNDRGNKLIQRSP